MKTIERIMLWALTLIIMMATSVLKFFLRLKKPVELTPIQLLRKELEKGADIIGMGADSYKKEKLAILQGIQAEINARTEILQRHQYIGNVVKTTVAEDDLDIIGSETHDNFRGGSLLVLKMSFLGLIVRLV